MNILISGADRSNGEFYDFTVDVNSNNEYFNLKPNEKLYCYPVRYSQLNDFYNVGSYNNVMRIQFYDSGTLDRTIEVGLSFGYYNPYTLGEELTTAIDTALNAETGVPGAGLFATTIEFNPDTNKMTIDIDNNTFLTASWELVLNFSTFSTYSNTLAQFLGFNETEVAGTITTSGFQYISTKPVDYVFQKEIYVRCSLVNKNLESSSGGVIPSNFLMSLPQDVAKLQLLNFLNTGTLFKTECLPNFSQIKISFHDNQGRYIRFNSDCFIVIGFIKETQRTPIERITNELNKIEDLIQLNIIGQYLSQREQ